MAENTESNSKKSYKGMAMEGSIARWYAKNTKGNIEQYKNWAKIIDENVEERNNVLEVAPGPGYLSIELAKLGDYNVTGLDISKTFVEIAQGNADQVGVNVKFRHGDASSIPLIMTLSISSYVQRHLKILPNQLWH